MKFKVAVFGIINALFWASIKEWSLFFACIMITLWVLLGDEE